MKILRITLNNIASLAGTHTVDFTRDPLRSAGLFSISGATGAGKSTLAAGLAAAWVGAHAVRTPPRSLAPQRAGWTSAPPFFPFSPLLPPSLLVSLSSLNTFFALGALFAFSFFFHLVVTRVAAAAAVGDPFFFFFVVLAVGAVPAVVVV